MLQSRRFGDRIMKKQGGFTQMKNEVKHTVALQLPVVMQCGICTEVPPEGNLKGGAQRHQ